jgi:hypothetical protein
MQHAQKVEADFCRHAAPARLILELTLQAATFGNSSERASLDVNADPASASPAPPRDTQGTVH